MVFDISTNKAGFDDELNCTSLLTSIKGLGTEGRSCTWKGNKQFDILLGSGATLLPGETITLRASKIRNKARYSTTLRPVAQPVLLPKLARAPGPGLLSGPQEVDVCSCMVLQLDVPSARPLEYSWSSTDKKLNDFLKCLQASSVIKLPSVFPQFSLETNIAYEISVVATDFLGQRSSILTHTQKKHFLPLRL